MTEVAKVVKKFRKITAADLLSEKSPLNKSFLAFCGKNEPTKRQGRKFLQKYPQYREAVVEVE